MQAICLHDKDQIRALLRQNPSLHLFGLGDLDDFYWPYTTWYTLSALDDRSPLALLYSGGDIPTLIAVAEEPHEPMAALLRAIQHLLPRRFYAHFSGDLASVLANEYRVQSRDALYMMALVDRACLNLVDTSTVASLLPTDLPEIEAFYCASHPENHFTPRMIATGFYYGIRRDSELASVAGIHVYASQERVAVLGNVATHPRFRGQGLARAVCAKLCRDLLRTTDFIGLHVKADNASAIALYERLGFARVAEVEACMMVG